MKPFAFLPKAVRTLLLINAVVFGLSFVFGSLFKIYFNVPGVGYGNVKEFILYFGAFLPTSPFEAWRYVTYMFVHVSFVHFLFNMMMLWMFGVEVAEWMGAKHFVGMYFFCGIFAAVFSVGMSLLGLSNNPIIGASGALMGIFVAYYKFFPERQLLLFFIVPMKIKHAIWVLIALDVLLSNSGDAIAHFAHLGGVVGGFIYMAFYHDVPKFMHHSPLSGIFRLFSRHPEEYENNRSSRSESSRYYGNRDGRSEVLEGEVFYMDEQKRMDDILTKVNRYGIQSLTESEKEFLLKAGDRMRRRRGGM